MSNVSKRVRKTDIAEQLLNTVENITFQNECKLVDQKPVFAAESSKLNKKKNEGKSVKKNEKKDGKKGGKKNEKKNGNIRSGEWKVEEERELLTLMSQYGQGWSSIHKIMNKRNFHGIKIKGRSLLGETMPRRKKGAKKQKAKTAPEFWSNEEHKELLKLHKRHGYDLQQISEELTNLRPTAKIDRELLVICKCPKCVARATELSATGLSLQTSWSKAKARELLKELPPPALDDSNVVKIKPESNTKNIPPSEVSLSCDNTIETLSSYSDQLGSTSSNSFSVETNASLESLDDGTGLDETFNNSSFSSFSKKLEGLGPQPTCDESIISYSDDYDTTLIDDLSGNALEAYDYAAANPGAMLIMDLEKKRKYEPTTEAKYRTEKFFTTCQAAFEAEKFLKDQKEQFQKLLVENDIVSPDEISEFDRLLSERKCCIGSIGCITYAQSLSMFYARADLKRFISVARLSGLMMFDTPSMRFMLNEKLNRNDPRYTMEFMFPPPGFDSSKPTACVVYERSTCAVKDMTKELTSIGFPAMRNSFWWNPQPSRVAAFHLFTNMLPRILSEGEAWVNQRIVQEDGKLAIFKAHIKPLPGGICCKFRYQNVTDHYPDIVQLSPELF